MKDKPPLPPTRAQAKVSLQINEEESKKQLQNALKLFQTVMLNKVFLIVVVISSVSVGSSNAIIRVFMGEVLRNFFIEWGYKNSYNSMSGLVLMCFEGGYIAGSILSGKFVDHFKNYHQQISIVLGCGVLSTVSLVLGYYFGSVAILFVTHAIFGICVGYLSTPLYETVFQHFYPADSGVLSIMIGTVCSLPTLLFGEIPRLIANLLPRKIAVLIYLIFQQSLSFAISLLLKPNYKRLAANQISERSAVQEEVTPLLAD